MSKFIENLSGLIEEEALKLTEPTEVTKTLDTKRLTGSGVISIELPKCAHYTYMISEALEGMATKAYAAGAMEYSARLAELNSYHQDLKAGGAEYIGEDGDMACVATTPRGALIKFRREADAQGMDDPESLTIDQVSIGYMHLPEPDTSNPDWCSWFVSWKKPTTTPSLEVYTYRT